MLQVPVILFSILLAFVPSHAIADAIIVEGGGAAISEIFYPMEKEYEKATGDTLKLIYSSPVEGLISMYNGKADLLAAITPLQEVIKDAALKGVSIDTSTLVSRQIGTSQVVVFIHSYNNVKKLTKKQLKEIFTGKITNWKDVGGDDEQIDVVWEQGNSGAKRLFVKEIMDGEPVKVTTMPAKDYYDIRDIISKTSGGIGIAPLGLKTVEVNVPDIPMMTAPIVVVTKGNPSSKVIRLLDFYTREYSFLTE